MIGKFENLEIRGYEQKTSQKGKDYLIVRAEDSTGKLNELYDPNIENAEYYVRGTIADFYLKVELGRYTNISVADFKIRE